MSAGVPARVCAIELVCASASTAALLDWVRQAARASGWRSRQSVSSFTARLRASCGETSASSAGSRWVTLAMNVSSRARSSIA
ncbi:hypothetical protein WR25_03821 [Diploscapter pachys]|uniref:Uncharacterized protein n=1 Tax=Diploscapter pachys TaxID=2018661 RepID=A0A2A2M5B9_9BILA|nr:hypothetical protein WR25_03821 [Diploscapter pachys]